jgi:DNA modification methylase
VDAQPDEGPSGEKDYLMPLARKKNAEIIEIGPHRLIRGDALTVMRGMPPCSVDLIVTDPPYGHNNNNNGDLIHRWEVALGRGPAGEARAIANDGVEADEVFRECLPEWKRLLRSGGCCCCCGGGGGPDPQFARWSMWMNEVFDFKQMVVWDKGPMGMGWHYRRSYETVLVASKPGGPCKWYDTTSQVENIIRPGWRGIRKIIPQADDHPAIKPVELMRLFIDLHSEPGDTVFDPFMGEGTTGIACAQAGRSFIGIELDEAHFAKARAQVWEAADYTGFAKVRNTAPLVRRLV